MQLPPVPAWRLELRHATLDPTAKLVGYVLSTYMDGAGRAQVSRSVIAEGCGLTDVDTVRLAVKRLERAGLLGVDRAGRRQHLASRYQARSSGLWEHAANGSSGVWGYAPDSSQGPTGSVPGAYGDRGELEVLEVQDRGDGDGYGSPRGAELARAAAAAARRKILAGDA